MQGLLPFKQRDFSFVVPKRSSRLWHILIVAAPLLGLLMAFPSVGLAGQLKLYWSVQQDVVIRRANLDGTATENVVQTPGGIIPDIAFDPKSQKIYWPSPVAEGIQRANYDGTEVEVVVAGLKTPTHLAVDSVHGKIYWAELDRPEGRGSIWRSSLDGSQRELLVETGSMTTALEVDSLNGYFYWSEFFSGSIYRATFENTESSMVFDANTFGQAGLPQGLAIDPLNGYVYATDLVFQAVLRMKLDGSEPELWVTDGVSDPRGIAVDAVNQRVYWSNELLPAIDQFPHVPFSTNISSVDFNGGNPRIDFVPLRVSGAFASPANVRHLTIVEVPIPEPSGMTLTIVGATVTLLRNRRFRKKASFSYWRGCASRQTVSSIRNQR